MKEQQVTAAIGVLCARVRVEEKQLLAALAKAGVPALPLAPAASPYSFSPLPTPPGPVGRLPEGQGTTGHLTGSTRGGADLQQIEVVVDRLTDRTLAAALLPLLQAQNKVVLGAGLAATGNRAVVAAALAAAGLPRPAAYLAPSESAAITALARTGFPATLMPLAGTAITLWDEDSAEAILEHRSVLGGTDESIVLVQTGAPPATERALIQVVGGIGVAADDPGGLILTVPGVVTLAEAAADTLGAAIVGVEIALTADGLVVWDVLPAPDFREATPLAEQSAAAAIADLAAAHLADSPSVKRAIRVEIHPGANGATPATNGAAASAVEAAPAVAGLTAWSQESTHTVDHWSDEREVGRDAVLTA